MRKRRAIEVFSISFLDLLSGALGAVIILYVAIPKHKEVVEVPPVKEDTEKVRLLSELENAEKEITSLKSDLNAMRAEIASKKEPVAEKVPEAPSSKNLDIGFKFKGRDIVFIIDTSYSMIEEERITSVKAGLKMLLSSLSSEYKVDIVQYPLGMRAPFRSMWGATRDLKSLNKYDSFEFIYSLKPYGGTPTRDTLEFVLKNYNYISDIVLLSDGAPTYHNSNKKDDIYDILKMVRGMNTNKIQINTIGVGSSFASDKTTDEYKFLSLLAEENNGFFIGF